jgi:hypothetical protein
LLLCKHKLSPEKLQEIKDLGQRLGEGAHAAADITPDAALAVGLAHEMVEEDVGG